MQAEANRQLAEPIDFPLQYYSARHTWATLAANDAGIDGYTVARCLNHVDERMRVTEMYIRPNWQAVDDAQRKVIDLVNCWDRWVNNKPHLHRRGGLLL